MAVERLDSKGEERPTSHDPGREGGKRENETGEKKVSPAPPHQRGRAVRTAMRVGMTKPPRLSSLVAPYRLGIPARHTG